ncbi:cysteine-rich receptor-like protein kinase [Trifolium pratense]|uniref:Cysteine-rich receptor-like protein kinase n=1 Tax=Trifolium pratense TaxID=57577 RepID=A0A2K3PM96_TRIPR|nr:cysteine-rich receptor-like protein kinase [Trifolium pratense]
MLKLWSEFPGSVEFVKHNQNIEGRLTDVRGRRSVLEEKGENVVLTEFEREETQLLSDQVCFISSVHWNKARLLWLTEGGVNSKVFHGVMSAWKRVNSIAYWSEMSFSDDSNKSLGLDGINFGFIKDFLAKVNNMFIVLIPKGDNPQTLGDFHPNFLVGGMYKVLAKVLANRLKAVMGDVISESQLDFAKGRQILDSIMIANEVVNIAKK